MSFYDFVEIGTSDFDTEIQLADDLDVGLSIDPIQEYLDRLPNKKNCQKLIAAVSNRSGQVKVNQIPLETIQKLGLNNHLRGCSYIGDSHPGVEKEIRGSGYDPKDIIVTKMVPMVNFQDLVERFKIQGIHYLKIDTEGHDPVIIDDYCQLIDSKPHLKAHRIRFESNFLTSRAELTRILTKLFTYGYQLVSSLDDTVVQLPFDRMYQRVSPPFNRYFIDMYPEGYDHLNKPHQQTLESAISYARKIQAGGVTYEHGVYSVRAKTKLVHIRRSDPVKSWVIGGSIQTEVDKRVLENCPQPTQYPQQNWVMVSAFYNLDRYQDTITTEARSSEFYRDKTTIFAFDIPLIFFCDPSQYQYYYSLCQRLNRLEKTLIVPLSLEEFFFFRYVDTIRVNRKGNPHYINSRNTPAYACLVMSKIEMVYRASKLNPFQSQMIAWIDYAYNKRCGEFDQFNHQLTEIMKLPPETFPPDKYVLGLIDWVTDRRFYSRPVFYGHVTTTFCGAFHFGRISAVEETYQLMKKETIETIEARLGHAEEQIFFFTFLQHRKKFIYFPTDYGIDIFNLVYPQRGLNATYMFMLPHLLKCQEYQIANNVVQMLYKSLTSKKITISPDHLKLCQSVVQSYCQQASPANGLE